MSLRSLWCCVSIPSFSAAHIKGPCCLACQDYSGFNPLSAGHLTEYLTVNYVFEGKDSLLFVCFFLLCFFCNLSLGHYHFLCLPCSLSNSVAVVLYCHSFSQWIWVGSMVAGLITTQRSSYKHLPSTAVFILLTSMFHHLMRAT